MDKKLWHEPNLEILDIKLTMKMHDSTKPGKPSGPGSGSDPSGGSKGSGSDIFGS